MATALSSQDVQNFRKILLGIQGRLRNDLDQMTDEALRRGNSEASGNLSNTPIHLADVGTENFDQDFTLGLIENEQETLNQIAEALGRIEAGTFGACENCHEPISKSRLQAVPYARFCIKCARQSEVQG